MNMKKILLAVIILAITIVVLALFFSLAGGFRLNKQDKSVAGTNKLPTVTKAHSIFPVTISDKGIIPEYFDLPADAPTEIIISFSNTSGRDFNVEFVGESFNMPSVIPAGKKAEVQITKKGKYELRNKDIKTQVIKINVI
jgi:hypothetical protein